MKQKFYFKTLLVTMLALFFGTGVYADTSTLTFTAACGGSGTADDGVEWDVTSDATESTFDDTRGIHYGTGKVAVSYLQLSTSGINGTITSIVVNASGASGTSAKLNVTVGDKAFGSEVSLSGSAANYTLGGSASGDIIVRLSQSSAKKALYVKSIAVTYLSGEDTRTPVTLTYSAASFTTPTESGVIEGAPTLTVDPVEATSEVIFSSSDEGVATVDADGVVTAVSPGTTTITASIISNSTTYRGNPASYTLKVGLTPANLKYNPVSVTVTYDNKDNFADIAPQLSYKFGYDGTITYTSSNPRVATVAADGTVTILAVGETEITASGAATEEFKASEASFTLTVNDIKAYATGGTSLFKETFDKTTGNSGWSGNAGSGSLNTSGTNQNTDENGWVVANGFGGDQCAKFGTSSKNGSAKTREIEVTVGQPYILTFKAAPWAQEATSMDVSIEGGTIGEEDIPTTNMTYEQWNDFSATIIPTSSTIQITFEASQNRFFLDEVNVATPATENVQVTIPSSGWGTYCCKWPLDFTAASAPEGLKAYAVSSTSTSNVTLTEITEKIIGGTGIIINGTPGETYTINVADQGAAYSGTNLLTGTLAPTYVEEGQYFLKSGKFVYSSAGTLPANKAYLKSANAPEAAANLGFVVEESTGISEVLNNISLDDDKWYDLSGRVVSPTSKGIYIHNGKKYIIK